MEHRYQDVAQRVASIVDWQSLGFPKGHGALPPFKAIAKRLWFESYPDLSDLFSVATSLCVYGFVERAKQVGLTLAEIPNGTPEVRYMYIHSCFMLPCCFLERAGDMEGARPLRELALNPPGEPYRLGPAALDGSMLANYWSMSDYDRTINVGIPLSDVANLAMMWVFGSPAREYTRERIGELLDKNLAEIRSIPKWQPW